MTTDKQKKNATIAPVQTVLVALCAAGTILLIWRLLKYSAYGIDFTDESFYLIWIANPSLYDVSIYLFGFIYHPLYSLLEGDIAALRRVNIITTFGLAWCLIYFFLNSIAPGKKENIVSRLTVSAGLATSAFVFFDSWLPTPSYNSLALQSLLVSAIGLIFTEKSKHRASTIGWLLIGVGGWLAFMAKPSTALALAVCVFIYLLLARKFSIRMLAIAVVCSIALLLSSALLIDGSIYRFIERLQLGVDFIGYLGGGHTRSQIFRVDRFQLDLRFKAAIFLISCTLFFTIWSISSKNKKWNFIGLLISIALFSFTVLLMLNEIQWTPGWGQFQGLLIFSMVYAMAISAFAFGRLKALKSISAQQWLISALFLIMPYVYAFGTNGNYWQAGGSAAIFWLLSGLALLGPLINERSSWLLWLPVAITTQTVTAILLQTGLEQPYRQPQPLRLNTSSIEVGYPKSTLVLSQGYAEYIDSAIAAAQKAGFHQNTPVIDLSGQSPGLLYAIGAENIGQPWTIGGYPGSLKFAEAALTRTPCEKIATAWLLFEKEGPRSIPVELMPMLGANFPSTYKQVGMWQTAEGAGGYAARRTQELYKPINPQETLMKCQILRQTSKNKDLNKSF